MKISLDDATQIISSTFSREDALWYYILYFQPKIGFQLPVLSLSKAECIAIQAPALCAFLPKIHINRNTVRSIIFSPEELGGLAFPHIYMEQGISKLQLFLGHLRLQDKTGKLIEIGMTYIQLLTAG